MLVRDGETLIRHALMNRREAEEQRIADWIKQQLGQCICIPDGEHPANAWRQWGKSMSVEDLMRKLHHISPKFSSEVIPENLGKRRLYFTDVRGRHQICLFENERMPEHSILAVKEEDVPLAEMHIDRKDLSRFEITDRGIQFDDTEPLAGSTRVKMLWHEALRGWRTVLVNIVHQGYATLTEVEREFGVDDRAEWQGKMGKSNVVTPW